jgi:hypothetical protein
VPGVKVSEGSAVVEPDSDTVVEGVSEKGSHRSIAINFVVPALSRGKLVILRFGE